ncbi:unnamed protein product [Caenorhabditis nigoni]
MFTLKYIVASSLFLLVSSQSWGQQSFGSSNQGRYLPLWRPILFRRFLGYGQQQQQPRSLGSSGFGGQSSSNQQGWGQNGQGFGGSNQQGGFGQNQASSQQGGFGGSGQSMGRSQQQFGQSQGMGINGQGFGGSSQQGQGFGGFSQQGQGQSLGFQQGFVQQQLPQQHFQSGGFNSQQSFGGYNRGQGGFSGQPSFGQFSGSGGQSGFGGQSNFGGQSGFGGNSGFGGQSGFGGNNFGQNNQGGFNGGSQNQGGFQGGYNSGNSNSGTFEPIPPFLNNMSSSAAQDYFNIVNNKSLTTNQINEQATNWASTNGVQVEFSQYQTNRTTVHNQALQNVSAMITNLSTVGAALENIQSNKSSSANDRQATMQQLQQQNPTEFSIISYLQNKHEQEQYGKMNGYSNSNNYNGNTNGNNAVYGNYGSNSNYGNNGYSNLYGDFNAESTTSTSTSTKKKNTKA